MAKVARNLPLAKKKKKLLYDNLINQWGCHIRFWRWPDQLKRGSSSIKTGLMLSSFICVFRSSFVETPKLMTPDNSCTVSTPTTCPTRCSSLPTETSRPSSRPASTSLRPSKGLTGRQQPMCVRTTSASFQWILLQSWRLYWESDSDL